MSAGTSGGCNIQWDGRASREGSPDSSERQRLPILAAGRKVRRLRRQPSHRREPPFLSQRLWLYFPHTPPTNPIAAASVHWLPKEFNSDKTVSCAPTCGVRRLHLANQPVEGRVTAYALLSASSMHLVPRVGDMHPSFSLSEHHRDGTDHLQGPSAIGTAPRQSS
jgi:hypothetical protein